MSDSQAPVFRKKQSLEKDIEYKRENLKAYKKYINPQKDEQISVLRAKKLKKELEMKNCFWIQFWAKSILLNEISNLKWRIHELESLKELERELDDLLQQLRDISETGWGEYPGSLDDKIVVEYREKFTTLSFPLTPKVPCINIIMIGETGSGKSSFLRSFTTALTNRDYIKDNYRVCHNRGRDESTTQQIHFEPIYINDKGPKIPCSFLDMQGIPPDGTINRVEVEKILNGELKIHGEMRHGPDMNLETQKPNPANVVHCILYVVNPSTTNLGKMSICMKSMIKLLKDKNSEDGVRQFVVVTSIDTLGVPNDDMKNAYKYPTVHVYCNDVAEAFGVDLLHVIPVSNYFEEVVPNDAKNAMFLFNLWRVFNSTKKYIERRWFKEETIFISKDWSSK